MLQLRQDLAHPSLNPIPTNGDVHPLLFPDDEPPEEPVANTMDATRKIARIRRLEAEVERIETQERESRLFYAMLKERVNGRIDNEKALLLVFLQHEGLTHIRTPLGNAQTRLFTVRSWPSDEMLVSWARQHCHDGIRIKYEPDKKALTDYIRSTGEVPEGYAEERVTRLYIA